ncbi:mannosyltransferase [Winogradskyella bathintestinalis]|uniref:Mannosyltransferase n=1 Tax=Winogradskyella bathintestinalis TaxID=3035208 RepID=A0ABT7ZQA1_9FLAO|nr:mannosyltransferase [Winogradskyella bathintestinalis]MDN3491190.1 mannosyltransferase [Winogradskyella bathintestinalis]
MIAIWKYHKIPCLFFILSCIFYVSFAYNLERLDTTKLLWLYVALFVFAFQIIKTSGISFSNKLNTPFKLLIVFSVLSRLIFLFAIPNLSQDFYRFIWDGRMALEGFNPYLYTPHSFIENGTFPIHQAQELYDGMGSLSASHFTNYPPINQLCFTIAALFSGNSIIGSVIVMRLIIIAADIGVLYFGRKLLQRLKLPTGRIFWYLLNPFIIIELTGNLHFEGVMIFFLVWSLYLLHVGKWKWAAVILACSISVKLIPLMLLPLFFNWFTNNSLSDRKEKLNLFKLIIFYTIIGVITLLFFLPFFSIEFITNYSKTVGLWFGNFEFNASIYYLARAIGYAITGYNEIAIIGKILPLISVLIILGFTFFKRNNSLQKLITSMLLVFTCYLFLSTTVHPWYIATLVILSTFTDYKFPFIWSLVVVLSYLAYSNMANSENLWAIALEYSIVVSVFVWEVFIKKRPLAY